MELLLTAVIIFLIIYSLPKKKKKDRDTGIPVMSEPKSEILQESVSGEIDYTKSYQSKYLLSKNEWYQYKKLKELTDTRGYVICPKVRLLDIVEPRRGERKYKTLFYKIQAKHIDFLICDADVRIKAIIELDDNSHDSQERKERDNFVDTVLKSVGYKVIHTKCITPDILNNI